MIRDLLRWVAPGLVTVFGGTVAALAMATPSMVSDLERAGQAQLAASDLSWAKITLDGREFGLSGTVESERLKTQAIALLGSVPGIANVTADVTIAPLDAPYRFNVTVEDGVVSLSGSVPNADILDELKSLPGLADVDLAVRAGQPDEEVWRRTVDFVLNQASLFQSARFELSDLNLRVTGSANSATSLGAFHQALPLAPAEVDLAEIDIKPFRVAPYSWTAENDGERIAISGYVPDEQTVERWRTADVSALPIATGLLLASGEPEGFRDLSKVLVEQLARLEFGTATIVDGVGHIEGRPPSVEVAQAVTEALSPSGSVVRLAPPPVADYWVSVTKQSGGILVFDGFVPDEATRSGFAARAGVDASYLKLGSGAPVTYLASVDFGLDLLDRMVEGRFALRGTALSVSGMAETPTDYGSLLSALETSLPQGISLGEVAIDAPRVASYNFALRRLANGTVNMSGFVPSPTVEANLLAQIKSPATANVAYGSGEPQNFLASAEQAIGFLAWLKEGEVRFDGANWQISGVPASAIDKGSIETEFSVERLAQAGWTLSLREPVGAIAAVSPYTWSAERLEDGSFLFAGNVPAQSMKDYLAVRTGARVTDTSKVSDGAPEGFAAKARTALDILQQLQQGEVRFDGTAWTLAGVASEAPVRDAALALAVADLGVAEDGAISLPAEEPEPSPVEIAEAPSEPVSEGPQEAPSASPVMDVSADEAVATDPATDGPAEEPAPVEPSPTVPADDGAANAALAQCRTELAELSAHNAILFQSGAALIAASAGPELDAFARTLAICPQTRIYVEGHTDSDGDDQKNLALSVARAEAVVRALLERGVDVSRLYAVGYGESQPVASNDTPDGKRQNRRIVVTVAPER